MTVAPPIEARPASSTGAPFTSAATSPSPCRVSAPPRSRRPMTRSSWPDSCISSPPRSKPPPLPAPAAVQRAINAWTLRPSAATSAGTSPISRSTFVRRLAISSESAACAARFSRRTDSTIRQARPTDSPITVAPPRTSPPSPRPDRRSPLRHARPSFRLQSSGTQNDACATFPAVARRGRFRPPHWSERLDRVREAGRLDNDRQRRQPPAHRGRLNHWPLRSQEGPWVGCQYPGRTGNNSSSGSGWTPRALRIIDTFR